MSTKTPKPYTKEWKKLANSLALCFAPRIYPCASCDFPVVEGYCCTDCGSANPKEKKPRGEKKVTP